MGIGLPAGSRFSLGQGRFAVRPGAARRAFVWTRGSAAQAVPTHPALTRAHAIHGVLGAATGRQSAAADFQIVPSFRTSIRLLCRSRELLSCGALCRPGVAESGPWMARGGESGMDA